MNVSIKKRIYGSFLALILLFVANGIGTVITLNKNRKLAEHVSAVINPSLQSLESFEDMLVASKMYTTNGVFLKYNEEDKNALRQLQNTGYPALKSTILRLSSKWEDKRVADSLLDILRQFQQLLLTEKTVMSLLQTFNDYDDPVLRLRSEKLLKEEILPGIDFLRKRLSGIALHELNLRNRKNEELSKSFMNLRILVTAFSIAIIVTGIFLSLYMARKIINPLKTIRHIVNDLGKGEIITAVKYKISNDEIGEMFRSVNNLSTKLQATAVFAREIGNRNFNAPFEPLGVQDNLGIALLAMRDNIRLSDKKFNEAQHLSHIGSWERIIKTGELILSDEIFRIFDIDPASFELKVPGMLKFIHPEDVDGVLAKMEQNTQASPAPFEFRIITSKGIIKNIYVQSKVVHNNAGESEKTFGILQDITERKQAEQKINAEKELFRLMIESMPDQIYLKDAQSRFLICNMPVAVNAGVRSQEEMIGKTDFNFYTLENATEFFKGEQELLQSGKSIINREQYTTDIATGKTRWSLTTKVPVKNAAGDITGLIGINRDITNRKTTEKKIEDVNRELSLLFNAIHEVFFSVNMETFKVIQISPSCEKLYGYKQADFLGNYKLWLELIHPNDKHVVENEDAMMKSGQQINNEYRIIRRDKAIRWVETKITPTLNQAGNLVRVDGVTRDITQRKQAEKEVERSLSLLEATIESTADGILVVDYEGKIVMFNKKFASQWHIPEDMLAAREHENIISFVLQQLNNPADFVAKVEELYADREALSFDTLRCKDGRTLERYSQPQLINGNCVGRVWNFRDITERKMAEKELLRVSRRLQMATRAGKVGIWDLDIVNNNLFWDDNMYRIYGLSEGKFSGAYQAWDNGLHPDDRLRGGEELQMAIRGEKEFDTEFRILWPDKSIHYLKANALVHRDKAGKPLRMIGTNWDITEIRQAEKALRLAQFTVENATHAIYWINPDGSFHNLNNAACKMLGYTFDELMQLSVPAIDPYYNTDLWPLHWEDLRKRKWITLITKQLRKDGVLVDVQVDAHYFLFDNMEINCAFVYDITDRKISEELIRKSEAFLEEQNKELERKNKELEQFAYVASHDLQEPLRTTISFVQILKQQYYGKLDAKADKYLLYIDQASDRMRVLIKDLLDFSRIGYKKDIEQVDCHMILQDVIADIDQAIKDSRAEITTGYLPVISGYGTELKQLFQNLLLNSIKFRKKNTVPHISITAQQKNDYWQFAFTDNGIGIDRQHNERIFIIFQRLHTRTEYQGSGIGLSHCKKIVELHHGKIWVESITGQGSTFYFTIHSPKQKSNEPKIKLHNVN